MKKFLSLAVLLFWTTVIVAQTTQEEMQLAQEVFGVGKKVLVSNFVNEPENAVFWTIYEEYENKRIVYAEETYKVLLAYADNYTNYSNDRAVDIMNNELRNRKKADRLLTKYYKKVKKQCGPKTATQFYMVQQFFDSTINAKILGNLPILKN